MLQPTGRRVPCCGGAPWSLLPGLDRDRGDVGVAMPTNSGVVFLCRLTAVVLERLQDRFLRVLREQVQVLPDAGLATGGRLALGHAGSGRDLRRDALDLLDTAVVVAGLQGGLLLGHGGLVLFLRPAAPG